MDSPAEEYLKRICIQVDAHLDSHLPPRGPGGSGKLAEAMRYSIFAGGKRIRPALALASFESCGGRGTSIFLATSALEMIHTFSLIHDDLPCMDDDDLRRGSPTSHKVFGEATAILAGDALCIHAFLLLARTGRAECVDTFASALGIDGMLGGQMADMLSEGKSVDKEGIEYIHSHKTAALLDAAVVIGAQLAGAGADTCKALSRFGQKIGLAFQIVDDLLDVEQTTEALGKNAGADTYRRKATYPAVLGIAGSRQRAQQLKDEAVGELRSIRLDTGILAEIADFIVKRVN